jgi:hypothetical protein
MALHPTFEKSMNLGSFSYFSVDLSSEDSKFESVRIFKFRKKNNNAEKFDTDCANPKAQILLKRSFRGFQIRIDEDV